MLKRPVNKPLNETDRKYVHSGLLLLALCPLPVPLTTESTRNNNATMENSRTSVESNEKTEAPMVETEREGEMGAARSSSEVGKVRIGTKPSEEFFMRAPCGLYFVSNSICSMDTACYVGNTSATSQKRLGEGFQYVRVDKSVGVEPNTGRHIEHVSGSPGGGRKSIERKQNDEKGQYERLFESSIAVQCTVPTPETRSECALHAENDGKESSDHKILDISGTKDLEDAGDINDETFDLREMPGKQ